MVDAVGTTAYTYDPAGQVLSENGPWADNTVSYTYANRLRTSTSVQAPNADAWGQSYGYDPLDRLTNVTSPAGVFGYYFGVDPVAGNTLPGSLIQSLNLPGGAYITNTYDGNARLTGTYLKNSSGVNLDAETYVYNQGNQRTQQVFTAGNYMNYTYDNIGELASATGLEPGGVTNRWQEQFGYTYDPAGNLKTRASDALSQTFSVNNLNELTQVGRSGTLTVSGTTTSPATNVTVNGSNAVFYVDNTFASTNQPLLIGSNRFTAIAQDSHGRMDTNIVNPFLPASAAMEYDLNGNMLHDRSPTGVTNRVFAYDDENQLMAVWVTNTWLSTFTYDGKMRRRIRREYNWQSATGTWQLTNEVRYVYDGNLVVQERDANNLPQITYTRGIDLSGSLQGADGIGGLLARTVNSSFLNPQLSAFASGLYHSDGNGNITALIYTNQTVAAKYEYDPYGNMLSKIGTLSDANLYRFSSKEYHPASGLIYYLYRCYDPNLQRWVNRDPINELGFQASERMSVVHLGDAANLYFFVANNPIGETDPQGLTIWVCTVPTSKGTPTFGIGRHAYFWDDRPGTPKNKRECGREGSSRIGGHQSGNSGPTSGATGNPWSGPGGATCYPVDGSAGKEPGVIACCQKNANKGGYVPGLNDCHTPIDDCLAANGLNSPPHPRGDPWSNHIDQILKEAGD